MVEQVEAFPGGRLKDGEFGALDGRKKHFRLQESCSTSMASYDLDKDDRYEVSDAHPTQDSEDGVESEKTEPRKKKRGKLRSVISKYKIKKPRLVSKHGGLKVVASDVPQKHGMYVSDMFTTMIDSKWRWISFIFITAYTGSWVGFGCIWYLLVYLRGDNYCVDNVDSFTSAFLFSLESQTTIGYGGRQITPDCPEAVILLNVQCLIGFLINAFILGLIFAKLSRPRNRAGTIMFSKKAIVCVRDGKMCLMFRVGDIRKSQILDCHIRVQLFRTRTTKEGQILPFYQQDLKIGIDWNDQNYGNNTIFLILPLTIIHVIDEDSPLYRMSPADLTDCDFELVAILEGTVEATGMLTQAKTSYVGDEILWGFEFQNTLDDTQWKSGRYRINFSLFNKVLPVNIPKISAMRFYEGRLFSTERESEGSSSSGEVFEDGTPDDRCSDRIKEIAPQPERKPSENGRISTLRDSNLSNPVQLQKGPMRKYEFENKIAYEGDDSDILFV